MTLPPPSVGGFFYLRSLLPRSHYGASLASCLASNAASASFLVRKTFLPTFLKSISYLS